MVLGCARARRAGEELLCSSKSDWLRGRAGMHPASLLANSTSTAQRYAPEGQWHACAAISCKSMLAASARSDIER